MKALDALLVRLDALSVKERLLVIAAAALVLVLAWQRLLIDPLAVRQRGQRAEIVQQEQAIAALERQAAAIRARAEVDLDAPVRARRRELRERITAVDERIAELAANLVAPAEMATVLERVLRGSADLELLEVRGLGASPLLPPPAPAAGGAGGAQVQARGQDEAAPVRAFKHGVRLSFRGGYLETLAYLRALETLPWRFLWEGFELQVQDYPAATASIVVYTLSLDRRWLGV